jgi:Fe-S cluster assembly protein SufD
MTQIAERKAHMKNFSRLEEAASGAPWMEQMRKSALARFEAVGFPSSTDEEWRHTNIAPITTTDFKSALAETGAGTTAAAEFTFGEDAECELVFVNGLYAPHLSRLASLPRGVRVSSLATAIQNDGPILQQYLAKYALIEKNPFVALNTGCVRDGAFLYFPRGTTIEEPIHLLFISTAGKEPTVCHPRVLVIAEENVEATIVESYVGVGSGVYFTNAVTEMVIGNDCRIDHCKLQQESLRAYHVAATEVRLGRGAHFVSHSASVGSAITRNDLKVVLDGEHADASLNGLVLIGGTQLVDNHTLLRHEKPHCASHELYKHVMDGRSTGVFKGKIFVQKGAQKTDSKQTSKSLLLSDDATMHSQPELEIYADDVKCTHGSTTGPVDEEMVFYLRSRGVPLDAARHLLTYAFAADITRRIKVEPVRRRLEDFMAAQHGLPRDLRITDLGRHDEASR